MAEDVSQTRLVAEPVVSAMVVDRRQDPVFLRQFFQIADGLFPVFDVEKDGDEFGSRLGYDIYQTFNCLSAAPMPEIVTPLLR